MLATFKEMPECLNSFVEKCEEFAVLIDGPWKRHDANFFIIHLKKHLCGKKNADTNTLFGRVSIFPDDKSDEELKLHAKLGLVELLEHVKNEIGDYRCDICKEREE